LVDRYVFKNLSTKNTVGFYRFGKNPKIKDVAVTMATSGYILITSKEKLSFSERALCSFYFDPKFIAVSAANTRFNIVSRNIGFYGDPIRPNTGTSLFVFKRESFSISTQA